MSRAFAVAGCLALLGACGEQIELAQTIVYLDADADARDVVSRLRVQAVGPSNESEPTVETDKPKWPIKLVLSPKNNDAGRTFTLYIEARDDDDDRRMTLKFSTGFVARQSRFVTVMIHTSCVESKALCGAGEICNVWELEVDADDLGRNARSPLEADATCTADGVANPPPAAGSGGGGAGGSAPTAGRGPQSGTGGAPPPQAGGCSPGYLRTPSGCVDIDDCADQNPCGDNGRCENTPGDYMCQCDPGYQSASGSCVASADCLMLYGGCESSCDDSSGRVVCGCAAGQWLKGDRKACGGFGAAQRLSTTASIEPMHPQIAFDADGSALAVWTQVEEEDDGVSSTLWSRRYSPGSGWDSAARRIEFSAGGATLSPVVALSAEGRGIVAWTQFEDEDGDMWAVVYRDGSFEEARRIDQANAGSTDEPAIVINTDGEAIAAWTQSDGGPSTRVWVNRFTPGSGWMGSEQIEVGNRGRAGMNPGMGNGNGNSGGGDNAAGSGEMTSAFAPRLSLDARGNAVLAWTQSTLTNMGMRVVAPWAARFDAEMGDFRPAVALDTGGTAGRADAQAFGEAKAVAVWSRSGEGRIAVRGSSFASKNDWKAPVNLATFDSDFASVIPRVAVAPTGVGAAIWAQARLPSVSVWASLYDGAADRWNGAMQLTGLESAAVPEPRIALDANGDGFAVWSEVRGNSREIKAARLLSDGGFLDAATLSRDTTDDPIANSPVHIAVDARGGAAAVWDIFETGEYSVWASRFD